MGEHCKLKKCETCSLGVIIFVTGAVLLSLGMQPVEKYEEGDMCDGKYSWDLVQCEIGLEKDFDREKKVYFKIFGPIMLILGTSLMVIPIIMWIKNCQKKRERYRYDLHSEHNVFSERSRRELHAPFQETSNSSRLNEIRLPSSNNVHHSNIQTSILTVAQSTDRTDGSSQLVPLPSRECTASQERFRQPDQTYNGKKLSFKPAKH